MGAMRVKRFGVVSFCGAQLDAKHQPQRMALRKAAPFLLRKCQENHFTFDPAFWTLRRLFGTDWNQRLFCMEESESTDYRENPPAETTSSFSPPDTEFQALDPNVIHLWRVNQFISSCILLFMASMGGLMLGFAYPFLARELVGAWIVFACFRLFLWVWYPPRAYRAYGYRLDEKVLEIKSGVYFRVLRLLPLNRLQHVDLHSGPFERYFGLASLLLHTAGTVESTLVIPGLTAGDAVKLRDHLVAVGGDDGV
jgi:uncharacterized protein